MASATESGAPARGIVTSALPEQSRSPPPAAAPAPPAPPPPPPPLESTTTGAAAAAAAAVTALAEACRPPVPPPEQAATASVAAAAAADANGGPMHDGAGKALPTAMAFAESRGEVPWPPAPRGELAWARGELVWRGEPELRPGETTAVAFGDVAPTGTAVAAISGATGLCCLVNTGTTTAEDAGKGPDLGEDLGDDPEFRATMAARPAPAAAAAAACCSIADVASADGGCMCGGGFGGEAGDEVEAAAEELDCGGASAAAAGASEVARIGTCASALAVGAMKGELGPDMETGQARRDVEQRAASAAERLGRAYRVSSAWRVGVRPRSAHQEGWT